MGRELLDYRPGHLDALLPMWRESFEEALGLRDPHPLQEQREYFVAEVLPRNAVKVMIEDGALAGFVAASPESIAQLYVRRGLQRRGIGTAMLDWARDRSCGRLWLYTFRRNTRACAFYERHGFRAVAHGFEAAWGLEDVRYEWSRDAS